MLRLSNIISINKLSKLLTNQRDLFQLSLISQNYLNPLDQCQLKLERSLIINLLKKQEEVLVTLEMIMIR
jgi:hypothetical protein